MTTTTMPTTMTMTGILRPDPNRGWASQAKLQLQRKAQLPGRPNRTISLFFYFLSHPSFLSLRSRLAETCQWPHSSFCLSVFLFVVRVPSSTFLWLKRERKNVFFAVARPMNCESFCTLTNVTDWSSFSLKFHSKTFSLLQKM